MREGEFNKLHEDGTEIYERLRLKTLPIAVKMLEKEKEIPEKSLRPKKDLGHHIATCQGFALSRRERVHISMLKEDMWCSEAAVGFGLGEIPQYFLEGNTRFPQEVKSLEAARVWAESFPRFEINKYIGVVSAPLASVDFFPDVVLIYCDSVQLKMLTAAKLWKDGKGIECNVNNCGACIWAVVPTMQEQKCNIALPCGGDRAYAICQDEELIFAAPRDKIQDLAEGLRYLDKYSNRVPVTFAMRPEFPLRESYVKVGKMIGMDLENAELLEENRAI